MNMLNFIGRLLMKLKSQLSQSFRRVATRALLVVLTAGAVLPTFTTSFAQHQQEPVAVTQMAQVEAAKAPAPYKSEIIFEKLEDFAAVAKEFPFVLKVQDALKAADAARMDALKEINAENSFYPGGYMIGKYSDSANGREFVFLHMYNTPNVCSYEGCPFSVFMKDTATGEFRHVLETMTTGDVHFSATKDNIAITVARGPNPAETLKYDAAQDYFVSPDEGKPTGQPPAPAPAPEVKAPEKAPEKTPAPVVKTPTGPKQ